MAAHPWVVLENLSLARIRQLQLSKQHLGPALLIIFGLGWQFANSAQALQRPVDPVAVCVVTPRVEPVTEGDAIGLVSTPMPLLVVVEPLLELRIERQGLLVWQQLAPAGRPFRAPLAWPLAPIAPGEVVLLRLRPEQAAEGSFAQVQLVGADAEQMARTASLILSLGQSPPAWLAAIETALEAGDVSLAWALLFEPQLPDAGDLAALRNEVVRRGCGD